NPVGGCPGLRAARIVVDPGVPSAGAGGLHLLGGPGRRRRAGQVHSSAAIGGRAMTTVDSSISRPGVGHALPRGSLRLESLGVRFRLGGRRRAIVSAVTDVSLTMLPGRVLAVVGESGCGKSALASAVLGLLPPNGEVRGRAFLHDTDAALDLAHCPEPILA